MLWKHFLIEHIIEIAVKPCQLNGISMDCSGSISVFTALYTLCMFLPRLFIVLAAALHKLLQMSISTTSMP